MSKSVPLPIPFYRMIEGLKRGEQIILSVHGVRQAEGKCEVVSGGQKPLRCKIERVFKKGKPGGNAKSTDVIFTRL